MGGRRWGHLGSYCMKLKRAHLEFVATAVARIRDKWGIEDLKCYIWSVRSSPKEADKICNSLLQFTSSQNNEFVPLNLQGNQLGLLGFFFLSIRMTHTRIIWYVYHIYIYDIAEFIAVIFVINAQIHPTLASGCFYKLASYLISCESISFW